MGGEREATAERVLDAPAVIAELKKLNTELAQENARLKHHLELLRRRVFGRSSEKGGPIVAEQHVLPFEPVAAGPVTPHATDEDQAEETTEAKPVRRRHPGRRALGERAAAAALGAAATGRRPDVRVLWRDEGGDRL